MRGSDAACTVTLLAHNGKRFDARILHFEHVRHGLPTPPNLFHADTVDVFKCTFPARASYKLGETYRDVVGHDLSNAHDADADVVGVCELLRKAQDVHKAIEQSTVSFSVIA